MAPKSGPYSLPRSLSSQRAAQRVGCTALGEQSFGLLSAKDNAREDPNDGSGSEATKWHFPCFSLNSTAPNHGKKERQDNTKHSIPLHEQSVQPASRAQAAVRYAVILLPNVLLIYGMRRQFFPPWHLPLSCVPPLVNSILHLYIPYNNSGENIFLREASRIE